MKSRTPGFAGFLGSFRALADGLLASVQHRIELFSVELREEKLRLIQMLAWISAAIFAGMMTVAFASLTLVYLFWESARLTVLGGLTLLHAGVLVATIAALRRFLARQPRPFAATLGTLGEDRASIRDRT